MMTAMRRTASWLFATILLAGSAAAQDLRVLLNEKEANQLPPEARVFYDEALFQNDRVNYDEVVFLLAKAAERAPNHAEIQFLTQRRARDRADIYYSSSTLVLPVPENMDYSSPPHKVSEPFLEVAEQALQRLVANPNLNAEQRRRLDNENQLVQEYRSLLPIRDKARLDTGMPIILQVQDDRRSFLGGQGAEVDPLDPYYSYAGNPTGVTEVAAEGEAAGETTLNPFEALPGEYIKPFLPPPPPTNQPGIPGAAPGGVDEFGNPIGPAGGFGPPAGPGGAGFEDAAADPFGGGAPADPAVSGDPGTANPFGSEDGGK